MKKLILTLILIAFISGCSSYYDYYESSGQRQRDELLMSQCLPTFGDPNFVDETNETYSPSTGYYPNIFGRYDYSDSGFYIFGDSASSFYEPFNTYPDTYYSNPRIYGSGIGDIPKYDSYTGITSEEWHYKRNLESRLNQLENLTHRGLRASPYADDPLGGIGLYYPNIRTREIRSGYGMPYQPSIRTRDLKTILGTEDEPLGRIGSRYRH